MGQRVSRIAALGAFCLLPVGAMAQGTGSPCKPLKQIASIEMQRGTDGRWLVPTMINGTAKLFVLSLNATTTQVSPETAETLNLDTNRGSIVLESFDGKNRSVRYAKMDSFAVGKVVFPSTRMMVMPALPDEAKRSTSLPAGFLGMDILAGFDFEIDFGANVLNLYDRDHCPSRLANMNPDNTVMVSLNPNAFGLMRFWVRLDGAPMVGGFFTEHKDNVTVLGIIKKAGLPFDENDPAVEKAGEQAVTKYKLYRRRFATLDLGGITVKSPMIGIVDIPRYDIRYGSQGQWLDEARGKNWKQPETTEWRAEELTLGTETLSNLHIYVASREAKLYLSPSTGPAKAATP